MSRAPIAVASAIAAIAGVGLAACGEDEPPPTEVTISISRPAELDPAVATDAASLESLWVVYTPLLTYRHAEGEEGTELIAGLAEELPEVSEDGRRYTLELREGLEYSDGSAVEVGDFEHAVQRALTLGGAAARPLERIAGARAYVRAGDPRAGIAGIRGDRSTGEITITLEAPDAGFERRLAMTLTAPVPAATPFRDMSGDPPPGVGPYALTAPGPDGGYLLERSATFDRQDIPDIPTGSVSEISVEVATDGAPRVRPEVADEIDPDLALFHPVFGNDYSSWALIE